MNNTCISEFAGVASQSVAVENSEMQADVLPTSPSNQEKPEIINEIDAPFPTVGSLPDHKPQTDLDKTIKLTSLQHTHAVEDLKNAIGKKLLYSCLIVIVLFAGVDALFEIDSSMFTSAFEVAKIVATTVLGYLFGSREKS